MLDKKYNKDGNVRLCLEGIEESSCEIELHAMREAWRQSSTKANKIMFKVICYA